MTRGKPAGRVLFAAGFEAIRVANGFTKKNVADDADVSPQYLADLLAGRAGASPEAAQKLANALGVAVEALFPEASGWCAPLVDRTAARAARRPRQEVA